MSLQELLSFDSISSISITETAVTLILSLIIGMFIFQIYKKSYQNVVYTKSFSLSLIMMTMVTSLVILAVTANVVLSLGMVGALSIVRFRAAIKDPMDIVFMFWSIAAGIVTGAGFYLLAVAGSIVIGGVMLLMSMNFKSHKPYMLIVNVADSKAEQMALNKVKSVVGKFQVKSKSVMNDAIELMLELRVHEEEMTFVNELSQLEGVKSAVMVSSHEYSI